MSSLLERCVAYALSHGVDIKIGDGPPLDSYIAARVGGRAVLLLTSGTVAGPRLGEIVYRGCEAIEASRRLAVNLYPIKRHLIAS